MKIYEKTNEIKYITYYKEKIDNTKLKIRETTKLDVQENPLDVIKEFWIFNNEGIELFSRLRSSNFNADLFGGFISAMSAFSQELTSKNIDLITIGSNVYTFYRENDSNFFILGRTRSLAHPEALIESKLRILYQEYKEKKFINFDDII